MPIIQAAMNMNKRLSLESRPLWYDASEYEGLLTRALQSEYTGVVLRPDQLDGIRPLLGQRLSIIVRVENASQIEAITNNNLIILSNDVKLLNLAQGRGLTAAYQVHITDSHTLHESIRIGSLFPYLVLSFKDPTNIPLELVIASLQGTETVLIKEIAIDDLDDAIVTLGVMEVGAEGILFTPRSHTIMDGFLKKWNSRGETLPLCPARIKRTVPIGMGYRSCIDLTTLFTPTEGMIVGSTSQGGILCCPEVFHLPYMDLRPFRVNAGAVHSYVFNHGNRTDYMTELKAGSPAMIVDGNGKTRRAFVGRMKTEVRPLRLIEVGFKDETTANILLQDDWHVRVYSGDLKPLNITELKPGDEVLAYQTEPGRHVGIKVSEHIWEN